MIKTTINARLHEEARVASAKLALKPLHGLAALRDQIAEQLRISVLWADEQEAMIGHVKAYLQWGEGEALMLSTTGGAVEVKGSALPAEEPETAEVGITAIVFGPELEAVEDRLEGMAAAIAGQNGEWCTYDHECEHHHHDHEHGEDCGCHDHDHDHDHDEHCDCHDHDHEHHHHHEHHHEHHHGGHED
jgi:hypothetical protein